MTTQFRSSFTDVLCRKKAQRAEELAGPIFVAFFCYYTLLVNYKLLKPTKGDFPALCPDSGFSVSSGVPAQQCSLWLGLYAKESTNSKDRKSRGRRGRC